MTTYFSSKLSNSNSARVGQPNSDKTENVSKEKPGIKPNQDQYFNINNNEISTKRPLMNYSKDDSIIDRFIDNVKKQENKFDINRHFDMRGKKEIKSSIKHKISYAAKILSANGNDITHKVINELERLHNKGFPQTEIVERLEKIFKKPYEQFSENNIADLAEEFFLPNPQPIPDKEPYSMSIGLPNLQEIQARKAKKRLRKLHVTETATKPRKELKSFETNVPTPDFLKTKSLLGPLDQWETTPPAPQSAKPKGFLLDPPRPQLSVQIPPERPETKGPAPESSKPKGLLLDPPENRRF